MFAKSIGWPGGCLEFMRFDEPSSSLRLRLRIGEHSAAPEDFKTHMGQSGGFFLLAHQSVIRLAVNNKFLARNDKCGLRN
jgi:hypothetical protein